MSQNLSGSGGSNLDEGEEPQKESFFVYGMYFCGDCKNIMTPIKQLNEKLEFKCKLCDKKIVDFTNIVGQQCIIYHKQLKPGSKVSKADKQFVMDPTLPMVQIQCPQCSHNLAVYIATPDDFQTAIQIKLICQNASIGRCDHTWTLPPRYRIQGLKLIQIQ